MEDQKQIKEQSLILLRRCTRCTPVYYMEWEYRSIVKATKFYEQSLSLRSSYFSQHKWWNLKYSSRPFYVTMRGTLTHISSEGSVGLC